MYTSVYNTHAVTRAHMHHMQTTIQSRQEYHSIIGLQILILSMHLVGLYIPHLKGKVPFLCLLWTNLRLNHLYLCRWMPRYDAKFKSIHVKIWIECIRNFIEILHNTIIHSLCTVITNKGACFTCPLLYQLGYLSSYTVHSHPIHTKRCEMADLAIMQCH